MRTFDDGEGFDSGLSMVKVNEVSPAIQEQVDMEIKRLLQVRQTVFEGGMKECIYTPGCSAGKGGRWGDREEGLCTW